MTGTRPFRVSATGTVFDGSNGIDYTLVGVRLVAGGAAATAVVRETDGSGAILFELSAVANTTDESRIPVLFKQKIHVTLSGAGATCAAYVA